MRRYQSHKIVEAAKILGIQRMTPDGNYAVAIDDGEGLDVPPKVFARGEPEVGDYMVRYSDGYLSWSPAQAFEDGYILLEDAA